MSRPAQTPQREWREQWTLFRDDERFLFEEWIRPATLEDLRGREVLEAGCGGGQHTGYMAEVCRSVTAVDLNTVELARQRNAGRANVELIEADCATMELGRQFDAVVCIGVIHHTDDPDRTFDNLFRHLRPGAGGLMIIWTYSAEGNALVRWLVEPLRKLSLRALPRRLLVALAGVITALLYLPVHTIYRLPWLAFLPYYDYFRNFRRLSFRRNLLNVFDKLNAPQTRFIDRATCERWLDPESFVPETVSIRRYAGVSYSLNGVRRP